MTMDEIINYAINSPENTNPNVLKSMLSSLNVGGGQSNDVEIIKFHIDEENKLDLTWQEIKDALDREAILLNKTEDGYGIIIGAFSDENTYVVGISLDGTEYFTTDSTNGYPILTTSDLPPEGGNYQNVL